MPRQQVNPYDLWKKMVEKYSVHGKLYYAVTTPPGPDPRKVGELSIFSSGFNETGGPRYWAFSHQADQLNFISQYGGSACGNPVEMDD